MAPKTDNPFALIDNVAQQQHTQQLAQRALSQARVQLILGRDAKSAFFASLLLRLQPIVDWQCETIATDGKTLHYQPAFVTGLSPDELVGVLAHEAMHCALAHPFRRAGRDAERWNIACDLAINPLLVQAGLVLPSGRLMPGEGLYRDLVPLQSADVYYQQLTPPYTPFAPPSQGPSADGSPTPEAGGPPDRRSDPGGCGQVIEPDNADPASQRAAEAEWAVALTQAQQAAAGREALPAGLSRSVHETLHPPADWRSLLRAFVAQQAKNDYSWVRPNRRLLAQGLYLPGLYSEELGDVVLAVDTSGSISPELLNGFASEVNGVLDAYHCTVTVLYHDTSIQGLQTWTSSDGPLQLQPVGGGGTNHTCVFEWLANTDIHPACVVCLTDLETIFPAAAPAVPVLWAVHGALREAPFGWVVPLDHSHNGGS